MKQKIKKSGKLFALGVLTSAPAWCQGTGTGSIDTSGFRTLLGVAAGLVLGLGAIYTLVQFVFSIMSYRGSDYGEFAKHLGLAIFGGIVVGFASDWVQTLTGVHISVTNLWS